MDTQMSPTPTPGTDLRPTPCAEAGEEGKARWGGGGSGAGVGRQASKAVQNVCRQGQSFLLCYDRTERATGLSKASLHLPL